MLTRALPRHSRTRHIRTGEFIVFCVLPRNEGEPAWARCGHARLNRDGSVSVQLDALPLNGELHLQPIAEPSLATSPKEAEVVPLQPLHN